MFPLSSRSQTKTGLGLLIVAAGGFLYTFDLPLLRLSNADHWNIVFARGVMLFLALTLSWYVMRLYRNDREPFIAGKAGLAVVASSIVANIAYVGAVVEAHAANVVFILALIPILTAMMSRIFINEDIHRVTWISAIAALFGVGIIVWDSLLSGKYYGDLLAFICACCMAASFTIARGSGKNVATSLGVGSLGAALIALIFFGVNFEALMTVSNFGLPAIAFIALNGLLVIPLATTFVALGPRYLPSVDVSMFFLLETALTPVWVWMLFGEFPNTAVLWGGLVVITTLFVHSVWRLRMGKLLNAPIYHD